jgi:hypothetical protein
MRPIPGSVYQVVKPFLSAGTWKCYEPGMQLELFEETTEPAPLNEKSKISNWIVKCPFFSPPEPESIWATIWILIEDGYLERADLCAPADAPGPPWTILVKERA